MLFIRGGYDLGEMAIVAAGIMTVTDRDRPLILPEEAVDGGRRVTKQFETRKVGAFRRQMSAWSRDRRPNRMSWSPRYFVLSGVREMNGRRKKSCVFTCLLTMYNSTKTPGQTPVHV